MRRIVSHCIATVLVSLTVIGCAPKSEQPERFIVPAPPEKPRIAHVSTYRGEADFASNGGIDTFIGDGGLNMGRNLNKPYGVAGYKGKVYATDTAQGVVFVFDTLQRKVTYLGDRPSGKLASPISIAFDGKGLTYVSDAQLKRIYAYDANGSVVKAFGLNDEFYRPTGIAINRDFGLLYVVDTLQHHIKVFSLDGKHVQTIGQRGHDEGSFNYPTNVAIDRRNGNVIVGDTQNFRIQIFDRTGKLLKRIGKIGDKPGMFARPKGIAVDSEGNIYAADAAFNNIQIFNEQGQLLLYFGGGGTNPGRFNLPSGLYFDEEDRLYTTEGFNARVQVFQYLSEQWKKQHPEEYKKITDMK